MRTFRMSEERYQLVAAVIEHRNEHSANSPWSFSDFVWDAIREKIAKMSRSRGREVLPLPEGEIENEEEDYYTPGKDGLAALADEEASA
jgi:hypothetical protein